MTNPLSVSSCIRRVSRQEVPDAAGSIWDFFHSRARRIAQHELKHSYKSSGDADDATNAAFFSCFLKLQNQPARRLGREEFWEILRRSVKRHSDRLRVQRYTRKCQYRHFSTLSTHEIRTLKQVPERSASADQEIELETLVDSLCLGPGFKQLLQLKLENHTNMEIAVELGVSLGTVERKLRLLRRRMERRYAKDDS